MKLKSIFFALIFVLSMSSSFANVSSTNLGVNELKTEFLSTNITSNSVVSEKYDDLCEWYSITTITTHNYFFLGVWVGSSIETETTIECR